MVNHDVFLGAHNTQACSLLLLIVDYRWWCWAGALHVPFFGRSSVVSRSGDRVVWLSLVFSQRLSRSAHSQQAFFATIVKMCHFPKTF